jgi:hypothetical protein
MRPRERQRRYPEGVAGLVERAARESSVDRSEFRELFNDPATLQHPVKCEGCAQRLETGDRAFAVQDYAGRYVGYVCPLCHPNRKWINGLWRSVLGEEFSRDGHGGRELPVEVISRTVH